MLRTAVKTNDALCLKFTEDLENLEKYRVMALEYDREGVSLPIFPDGGAGDIF